MQSAMFHTIVRLATMPEKTSSRNVSPDGQNYSPRMKFNSQTTPLTTFSLLLTICHVAQIHTFHLAVLMVVPTNLQIGTEHRRWDWEHHQEKRHKVYPDNDKERRFVALVIANRLKLQKCDALNKDFQLFILSSE